MPSVNLNRAQAEQGAARGIEDPQTRFAHRHGRHDEPAREGRVGVILHLGAKVREMGPEGVPIRDPEGLLKRLAKDRAMIVFKDMQDFIGKKAAFEAVIRQWITDV